MGRGKARGGRRGGAATTPQTQVQTTAEKKSPLVQLIGSLLDQAYNTLPEAERPKGEKKNTAITEVEKTTKQIVASDHTELQRLVVSLSITLSLGGVLSSVNAKKVIGSIFSFLVTEVTRHWEQYELSKDQVHPCYVCTCLLCN